MNLKKEAGVMLDGYPHLTNYGIRLVNIVTQNGNSKQLVFIPQSKNPIGTIEEEEGRVFKKRVRKSIHFFRKLDSWALQKDVALFLKEFNIGLLQFEDKEEGIVYVVSLDAFLNHGIKADYGCGAQIFLNEKYWDKEHTENHQTTLFDN
jgi:hypothetical protein